MNNWSSKYYEQVRDLIEERAGATTSDAQGIIEARATRDDSMDSWEGQLEPSEAADRILEPWQAPIDSDTAGAWRPPTKGQEREILKAWARTLHPHSYLGQWMQELIPCVLKDIDNDVIPSDTPATLRETLTQRHENNLRAANEKSIVELEKRQRAIEDLKRQEERLLERIAAHTAGAKAALKRAMDAL